MHWRITVDFNTNQCQFLRNPAISVVFCINRCDLGETGMIDQKHSFRDGVASIEKDIGNDPPV